MAYPDKFVENIDTAKLFKEQQSSTLSQVKSELNQPNIAGNVAGVGLEVGTGYATDLVTAGLLNPGTIYATGGASILAYGAANFTSGALSNYAAQRLRGEEEISWGELIQSGLLDIIPFWGQKLKGAKGVANIALQSGVRTVVGRQGEEAIDEQRWLTPRETLEAALIGGAFGGMFKGIGQGHAYWTANYKKYDLLEADKLFPPEVVQALIKAGRIRKTPRNFQAYMFKEKIKSELGDRPIRDWTLRKLFNQNLWKKSKGHIDPDDIDVQSRIMYKIEVLEKEISLAAENSRLLDGTFDIRSFDPANPLKTIPKQYKGEFLTIKFWDDPVKKTGLNEWRIRWSTTRGGWVVQNRIPRKRNITQSERKLWDRPSPLGKVGRNEIFKTSKEQRKGAERLLSHLLASGDPEDLAQYDKIIGASKDGSVPFYMEHIHDRRAPVWKEVYNKKGVLIHYEHKYKKNADGTPIRGGDPENLQITGDKAFDTMKTALENHIYSDSFRKEHGDYILDLQKNGNLLIRRAPTLNLFGQWEEGELVTWKSTRLPAKIYKTETDVSAAIQRLDDIIEGKAVDYKRGEVPLSERQETAYSDFYLDQLADDTFPRAMTDDVAIEIAFIKERISILRKQLESGRYSKSAERSKRNDIIDLTTKLRNLQKGT